MSTKKVHPLLRAAQDQNAVVENYSKTRARFNNPQQQNASKPVTDSHGFYVGNNGNLTERVAGLDKLFYTLVQGIVEDPDFLARLDSQPVFRAHSMLPSVVGSQSSFKGDRIGS